MDDKFLYQLREVPDPEFVHSLQLKLTATETQPDWRLKIRTLISKHNMKSRLAFALALILAAIMLLASISPVRAFVQELFTTIAGQSYKEMEDYPGDGGGEHIVYPQESALDDALARFPYNVKLPSYIPDRFDLDEDNIAVYTGKQGEPFSEAIVITWKPEEGPYLVLNINNHDWSATKEVVAPGSTEEVSLADGNPAALIRGGWDVDKQAWVDHENLLRLRWRAGGLNYDLHGNSTNLTVEQLIAIASSTLE